MLVHTCRCIFLFVVRKGFQKLFENAFEILEKEKKIEIFSLLSFWPEGLLLPPSAFGPRSPSRWPARPPQPAVH
jgi:hypothetical protein